MDRTLDQLLSEIKIRGIDPSVLPAKISRKALIDILAADYIAKHPEVNTWQMQRRLELESPMLCFSFKHLKEEEKEHLMDDGNEWCMEPKWDGCRCLSFYHPDTGFQFISRNISVETFLPVDYTSKILLKHPQTGVFSLGSSFIGTFKRPFITDCEILCSSASINTMVGRGRGTVTGAELNAVTAILSMNEADSHRIQIEQAPLYLVAFDLLYLGDWVTQAPLSERRTLLTKMVPILSTVGDIRLSPWIEEGKLEYFKQQITSGKEGVVLKNKTKPYTATSSRGRDVQVKLKRSMAKVSGDIDAYICGYTPSTKGKGFEHLIGGIKLAITVRKPDLTCYDHWIASVASMPLDLRTAMTEVVNGTPQLKQEYYGKVLVIDGQDMSPKSLRFMHACVPNWVFRSDKTQFDCLIDEALLKSQVL